MTITPEHLEVILRRLSEGSSLRRLCRDERARDPTFPAEATVRLEVQRDERFAQARDAQYTRERDDQHASKVGPVAGRVLCDDNYPLLARCAGGRS